MLSELVDRKLRLFRSKSFFSNIFRFVSNLLFSKFSRFSTLNSVQQSLSNALTFRELLNIILSNCLKIRNKKYVVYNHFHHEVFMQ